MRIDELAARLNLAFEGDGTLELTGVASIEAAGPSDLSFVGNRKAVAQGNASGAGCLIVPLDFPSASRPVMRAKNPRNAFAAAVHFLHPPRPVRAFVHPSAVIADSATVHPSCYVGANVVIGERSVVGDGTSIAAGTIIGDDVTIGTGCTLHANVTIYDQVDIGDHVMLHSGCVIGADGFGFVMNGDHYEKFPQIGRVAIADDVEIGANACVDRAALGVTSIGEGTKLDNMVHIAHNCEIGRHVVIAAQTGLSGGVVVGDYAVIGGQVGIGDKARIEAKSVLGSGSGVLTSKIVRAGEVMWGTPARPLKQYLRQLAAFGSIEELQDEIRKLREEVEQLQRTTQKR